MTNDAFYNRVSADRITSRQIDELIGIARGLCADGTLNEQEVEYLQKWLACNAAISDQPIIRTLFDRTNAILADGMITQDERADLFDTLNSLAERDFELGEVLKPTTLPLCDPVPDISFAGRRFAFTGTFNFGQRKDCERAVIERGGMAGGLVQTTDFLVIGAYATESWKHSSMGTKIIKACDWRDQGISVAIVSEQHWSAYL